MIEYACVNRGSKGGQKEVKTGDLGVQKRSKRGSTLRGALRGSEH